MTLAIHAACGPGELRVAVLRDGALEDFAIWRPGAPDGVADLHRARIASVVPAMAGAFVALADGGTGFLPDSEGAAGRAVGDAVAVRVVRAAQAGKGPRLSARLSAEEQAALAAAKLHRGPGPLLEVAARHPGAPVLIDDPGWAAKLHGALDDRLRLVARAFDEGLEADSDALAAATAALPGGLIARVEPTAALVAIDLDTGAATASREAKGAAQFAANRAVLPALAREIRLRNLSGAILIDFAGLSPRRRPALGPDLAAALAGDPLRPRLLGFTALGLAEIVRPRVRPPLHEMLAGPHAAGLAALRRLASESAVRPSATPALRASPRIVAALQDDPVGLADLARRTGRSLILRADPTLAADRWIIEE